MYTRKLPADPDLIADEKIRDLRRTWSNPSVWWCREFAIALGEVRTVNDPDGDQQRARARCAEVIRIGEVAARRKP